MDKTFAKDTNELYRQLRELGDRARKIIRQAVEDNGGEYTFDTENEDEVWVGEDRYATEMEIDGNGNVLVFNSAGYSEYLQDMYDYNILDLANRLKN